MPKQTCFIILTPGFPENETATTVLPFAQSFVLSFIKEYPNIKLIVISFQYPFTSIKYEWYGAEVFPLNGRNKGGFSKIVTWVKALNCIRVYRKQYFVKGILSFWLSECAFVGQWAKKIFKINQYSWICGQDAKPENRLLKYLQLNNNTIISKSPKLLEVLGKHRYITDIKIIPNGISQSYFDSIKKSSIQYDILGVGSLIELKNYKLFIKIISLIKIDFPNIKSAIIGCGTEEQKIKTLINEFNLKENIELKGLLPHEEVIANMKSSNILLHTSHYEGQAAVFIEALYCGMKVICFDVGRLHSDENMFVCDNETSMIEVLKSQLINFGERKSILLQSMEGSVNQIMELYN